MLLTIFVGVSVFVLGQFFLKLVLDPIVELKKTLGNLSALFLREQNPIVNARGSNELQTELNRLSSSLLANRQAIPWYKHMACLFGLPTEEGLLKGTESINFIAYHLGPKKSEILPFVEHVPTAIIEDMKAISANLGITVAYE